LVYAANAHSWTVFAFCGAPFTTNFPGSHQPGGRGDRVEDAPRDATRGERVAQLREPLPAGDHAEVGGVERRHGGDRIEIPLVHRRDEHPGPLRNGIGRGLGDHACRLGEVAAVRLGIDDVDTVTDGVGDAHHGAGGGRGPEHHHARNGQDGFDVEIHGPSTLAGHRQRDQARALLARRIGGQAEEPRLAVGDGSQRLAQQRRARAAAAHPAVHLAVPRHQGGVAHPGRARRLAPHDGDEREPLAARGEPGSEVEERGPHGQRAASCAFTRS
jgi:hypothetical protein